MHVTFHSLLPGTTAVNGFVLVLHCCTGQVLFETTLPWTDDEGRSVLSDRPAPLALLYDPMNRLASRMCEHDARVSAHNNRASAAGPRHGSAARPARVCAWDTSGVGL